MRVLLPLLLFAFAARASTTLDVEALLDHHAAAHGLSRKASDPRALHLRSEVEAFGLRGSVESWSEPPLRAWSKLVLGPIELETGFDGETAWLRDRNGAVREAEAQERNGLLLEALLQTGAYLLEHPPILLRRSAEEFDSTRVRLTLEPMLGDEMHLYLDAFTHRVVGSEWHNGQATESSEYSDYEWFDELLLPKETVLVQGNLRLRATLISVERSAPRGVEFYRMPDTTPPADLRLGDDGSSGRLAMRGEGDHILLDGTLGERSGVFLIDTGAGSNVLDAALARELGLIGEGEFEAIGVAGTESASFVTVHSVRLGQLELLEQSWVAVEFGALRGVFGEDLLGVLGYDTLSRLVVHVDYAAREVEFLARDRFAEPEGATPLRLRMDMNVPTVRTLIEGHEAWLHVDTGSDNTLDLAAPFLERTKLLEGRENLRSSSLFGVGGSGVSRAGELSAFELGPFRHESVEAFFHEEGDGIFENRSVAGIVGAGILSDYELWFDYAQRTLWLRPYD